MKKITLLLTLLLTMLVSSVTFAQTSEYKVYIDKVEQPFTALMDEDVYLPLKEIYQALGGEFTKNTAYDMDVYVFENKVIEIYNDDYSIYEDDLYIGDAKVINDRYYGHIDIASIDGINAFVDYETGQVDFFTSAFIETVISDETAQLKEQAPEFVDGMNRVLGTSVEMDLSGSLTMDTQSLDPETPMSMPFKHMAFSGRGNGYVDIENTEFDIELSGMMDTGGMTTRLKGIQMKLVGNTMYLKYPLIKGWIVETFDETQMAEIENDPLYQKDKIAVSILRDYLTIEKKEDGKVSYIIALNTEDVNSLMTNENYGDFLLALEREFKEDMTAFEIEEIRIEYVFNNNDIEMMRMNFAAKFGDEKEIVHMNMDIQANYKNRGIIREIDVPDPSEYL